jgi:flagellar protein FliO/FliZ
MNPSSLMPLLALVVVILAIPAVLWLLRRGGLGGVPQSGLLKQVASLSLSPSQRVVIVELSQGAQAQWLVLGVSPDRVNTLTTLEAPDQVPETLRAPQAATVQQLLQRWRQGPQGGAGHDAH